MTSDQKNARVSARQAAKERERQAAQLRLAGGTYQQIADQLGYHSRQAVQQAVFRVLDKLAPLTDQEELRTLEAARLDAYQRAAWAIAMGTPAAPGRAAIPGNLNALDRLLAIHDRRYRLMRLNREPMVDAEAELRRIAAEEGLDEEELLAEHRSVVKEFDRPARGRLRSVS